MNSKAAMVALCTALGLPGALHAETPTTTDRVTKAPQANHAFLHFHADYGMFVENLDLPEFSEEPTDGFSVYQRAQVGLSLNWTKLQLVMDLEAVSGQLYGDEAPELPERVRTATRPDEHATHMVVDPYEFFLKWQPGLAEIRLGLMTSDFGLGLVADNGEAEEWRLFNRKWGADRGLRALVATKPLAAFAESRALKNVYMALGADMVWQDDNASLLEGDRALQFLGTLFYQDSDPSNHDNAEFLGAYVAYRQQTDREVRDVSPQDELNVLAVDISGYKSWTTANNIWIRVGGEAAILSGETTRAYAQSGAAQTNVLGLGALGEAQMTWKPANVSLRLLSGYASGDANSDDDTLYRFRFDPNYKVGLVLFDHYIPAVTREAYTRVTDPTQSGEPQRGVFGLINDGAIENAVYVNPQLLFGRPDSLMTGVGMVWAWSAEPLADPYNTFASGGTPTGVNGRPDATRDLGLEVNVAAQYTYTLISNLKLNAKAEYGILFPGDAFDDAAGNSAAAQSLVRGRLGLSW
jgi:hypothetical protein